MSRRSSKRTWSGPLPQVGDEDVRLDPEWVPDLPPVERSWMDWWPSDPAESDEWARETLRVVESVWRRTGARIYYGPRYAYLREELHAWLVEQSMRFRERFVLNDDGQEPLGQWCRVLYVNLTLYARRYIERIKDEVLNAASLDQLEGWARDAPMVVGRRALHGTDIEAMDPLKFVLLIEALEHGADPDAGLAPKDPSLCTAWDCQRLAVGHGLCEAHASRRRLADPDRPVCAEPDCDKPAKARGLCGAHYAARRRQDPDRPVCAEPDCDKPAVIRGICETHYAARQRHGATLPERTRLRSEGPCSVDGCDSPARALGLCKMHYTAQRRAAAPPCTIDGCETRAHVRGLCSTHNRRAQAARKAQGEGSAA